MKKEIENCFMQMLHEIHSIYHEVFLDKVIKEAIEKQKDDDDELVKARSYDQDIFSKFVLHSENNASKMNKSSSDGEENDFDI
jgi:hypothetical protein